MTIAEQTAAIFKRKPMFFMSHLFTKFGVRSIREFTPREVGEAYVAAIRSQSNTLSRLNEISKIQW